MELKTVESIFHLAGIEILKSWEIYNKYTKDVNSPWWLVKTKKGLIEIGWRRHVIHIDWSDTEIAKIVTNAHVTKGDFNVHADSYNEAIEYLQSLSKEINN